MTYAAVFPLVRTRAFSEAFDYEVPRELVARAVPGALAAVPLGAQTVIGVVLSLSDSTSHEGRVLPLRDVLHVPPIPRTCSSSPGPSSSTTSPPSPMHSRSCVRRPGRSRSCASTS